MKATSLATLALLGSLQLATQLAQAWDYEGHRTVNLLALASLPTNFPAFARSPTATERIAFLAGEADRWRNVQDVTFSHVSGTDHYIDLEQLNDYGLKAEALPIFRYDFVGQLAIIRKEHPEKFTEPDPSHNKDHSRELIGFLPWAMAENYSKLKSCFAYLKAFQDHGGTPDELANAEANVVYVMGQMGHYFGDASQPLHTTIHHHGWVGDNPQGYTTAPGFHSWIDGGYFRKVGGPDLKGMEAKLRPAHLVTMNGRTAHPEEMFQVALLFVLGQNKLVEPLYQMDKDGKLSGEGEKGLEGKAFLEEQLLKSGQLLGDTWYSAWQQAPPDTFLVRQLARREQMH